MFRARFALAIAFALTASAQAGDWPRFRGPDGTGLSTETKVPTTWSATENIAWKTPLEGTGNSSPIVVGSKVFVTCATEKGKFRTLHCFDRSTGKELWKQTVSYELEDPTHNTNPYCGSSPASDGKHVVVYEGSAGVHCYDLDGKKLWSRDLGECRHIWGYGSSPVFHEGKVLVNYGPGVKQQLVALDAATGDIVWSAPQADGASGLDDGGGKDWTGSWSTPLVTKIDGQTQIVVAYPKHVQGFDPATGKALWEIGGLGKLVYTDTLIADGYGVSMSGYHGPAIGYKLGGSGDRTESNRLWVHPQGNPQRIGSGVLIGKHIFMGNENGTLQCLDVTTGEEKWRERASKGTSWCSLLHAEGRLYLTNRNSVTYVIAANAEKYEPLGENTLGEPTNATPAFSNGQIFHRTAKHLWCIGKP